MAYVIICMAILFIVSKWIWKEDFGDVLFFTFCGLILGGILFFTVGAIIGEELAQEQIMSEREICALNDSSTIEGKSFLLLGYIDEEPIYRYVVDSDRGKYVEELSHDNVYIEEGDYTPMLRRYGYGFEKDWYQLFANAWLKNDTGYYYVFYVPEGTVTNEYNVDLN